MDPVAGSRRHWRSIFHMCHNHPMKKSLRLMSWNLLEGCHIPKAKNRDGAPKLDPDRLAAAQALVAKINPDILVINEALWCQEVEGYRVDYAQLFGFPYSCVRLYDGVWGNAILSKLEVSACHNFSIYNRGGLVATLRDGERKVQVGTYHPHPSRYPQHKAADYLDLIKAADGHIPLALCGDFNAISPEDHPDHEVLTKAFEAFSSKPGPDSARFIDGGRAVFQALLQAGMRDAIELEGRKATMPTRLVSDARDGAMRIDHIWVNAISQVRDGLVIHDALADAASDHYPVVVDLDI